MTFARCYCERGDYARFSIRLIVATSPMSHDEILDVTDALGEAGCTDTSIRGTQKAWNRYSSERQIPCKRQFFRVLADVEAAGHRVVRVEMEREAITTNS